MSTRHLSYAACASLYRWLGVSWLVRLSSETCPGGRHQGPFDSRHREIFYAGLRAPEAWVKFDLVAEDEIGAGIGGVGGGELVAQRGEGLGAPEGGQRVEPGKQDAGTGTDVAGDGQCLADRRVFLVAGVGVVPVQRESLIITARECPGLTYADSVQPA